MRYTLHNYTQECKIVYFVDRATRYDSC